MMKTCNTHRWANGEFLCLSDTRYVTVTPPTHLFQLPAALHCIIVGLCFGRTQSGLQVWSNTSLHDPASTCNAVKGPLTCHGNPPATHRRTCIPGVSHIPIISVQRKFTKDTRVWWRCLLKVRRNISTETVRHWQLAFGQLHNSPSHYRIRMLVLLINWT